MVVAEGFVVWDDVADFSVTLAEVECFTVAGLVVADGIVVCDDVPVLGVCAWAVCSFGDDVASEDPVSPEDPEPPEDPVSAEMVER